MAAYDMRQRSRRPVAREAGRPVRKSKKGAERLASRNFAESDTATQFLSKYTIRDKIASGSFGDVYHGIDKKTQEPVAIKLEARTAKHPQYTNELDHYRALQGVVGVPRLHFSGSSGEHNVIVVERLGSSLAELHAQYKRFSLKTTLLVGLQMMERLEDMHEKGRLHRDVKPDNFLMGIPGTENEGLVHVIDFGLSSAYVVNNRHIAYRENRTMVGTARYASICVHLGIETSRRDDMESLVYVLLFFLKGELPWQGLPAKTKSSKYRVIRNKKQSVSIDELVEGVDGGEEFGKILADIRDLKFMEAPDYDLYRALLNDLFRRRGYVDDGVYDWTEAPLSDDEAGPSEPASADDGGVSGGVSGSGGGGGGVSGLGALEAEYVIVEAVSPPTLSPTSEDRVISAIESALYG